MPSPSTLARWEGLILVFGFFAIIFWRLMRGAIPLDGLLYGEVRDRTAASGYRTDFSPGRGQLLMITILTAAYFLLQVIHNPKEFPQVPDSWVAALGGSQAIYLGGKAKSMLIGPVKDWLQDVLDRRNR